MTHRLGFVGIIVEDRATSAEKVNAILSEYGNSIIARMGLPNADESASIITLIVKTDTDELGKLTGKLGMLNGVSVRSAMCKQ